MTAAPPDRRARTVFIGTGPFGVEALRALATRAPAGRIELVGVVTTPGRPAGRRGEILPSPIEAEAHAQASTPVVALARLRPAESVAAVLALRPDLIVLADDGRIVPPALLAVPMGALNLHPSLLPRHRGATPIPSTILAGDTETAVTIIRMDDGIDTGPIVAVERFALTGTETAPMLEARLAIKAADLLMRTLAPWLDGQLTATPQPDQGATLTHMLRREDGRLDPAGTVAQLERRVRALQPWPGTYLDTAEGRLVVHSVTLAPTEPGDIPGHLVAHGPGLALVAADGRLVIVEAQLPGGRRMAAADLRRGRPRLVGTPAR